MTQKELNAITVMVCESIGMESAGAAITDAIMASRAAKAIYDKRTGI